LITMANFFSSVELAPPVEVFALVAAYNEDNHEKKVNLGIGGRPVLAHIRPSPGCRPCLPIGGGIAAGVFIIVLREYNKKSAELQLH